MPNEVSVLPTTVDSATPVASKYRQSRKIRLTEAQFANLQLVDGYGDTAGELVLSITGIDLLPHEVLAIAIPVYAEGIACFDLLGTPTAAGKVVGVQVVTLQLR
jgi:hypothetical protein